MRSFSIITPVYNVGKYLGRCLDSIESQIISDDIEIILINDGSKDDSLSVCEEYKARYDNIHVISQENKGASAARNVGLDIAKGDYIWFVDADDMIQAKSIELILGLIRNYNDTDVFCFNHSSQNNEGVKQSVLFSKEASISCLDYLKMHTSMYLWDKIFKRTAIGDVRFLDGIRNTEDMLFTLQVMLRSSKVRLSTEDIYVYNQTNPNSTLSNRKLSSLLKNSSDTLVVHKKMMEMINDEKRNDYKNELVDILNLSVSSHLFSYFYDRLPANYIKNVVNEYRSLGLYPVKDSYNKKGNRFNLLANREWLFVLSINIIRRIKGARYIDDINPLTS